MFSNGHLSLRITYLALGDFFFISQQSRKSCSCFRSRENGNFSCDDRELCDTLILWGLENIFQALLATFHFIFLPHLLHEVRAYFIILAFFTFMYSHTGTHTYSCSEIYVIYYWLCRQGLSLWPKECVLSCPYSLSWGNRATVTQHLFRAVLCRLLHIFSFCASFFLLACLSLHSSWECFCWALIHQNSSPL